MNQPNPISTTRQIEPLAVTVQEARRVTGISNSRLYELLAAGKLRSTHIGRRRLIIFASLKEVLGLTTGTAA
jgi:excisionase family DNA binding protein